MVIKGVNSNLMEVGDEINFQPIRVCPEGKGTILRLPDDEANFYLVSIIAIPLNGYGKPHPAFLNLSRQSVEPYN
jgi:hypothetical protein